MMSRPAATLVHAALLKAPGSGQGPGVERVLMLQDDNGMTSHGRRPELIKVAARDTPLVSTDLAEAWARRGACRRFPDGVVPDPEPPKAAPPEPPRKRIRRR